MLFRDLTVLPVNQVGEKNIAASFDKKVKKKKMSVFDANVTKSRLIGLTNEDAFWPKHFKNCDVVSRCENVVCV